MADFPAVEARLRSILEPYRDARSVTKEGAMSPALRKRMQGKSCFNFTKVDEPLFEELATITAKGVAANRRWSRTP